MSFERFFERFGIRRIPHEIKNKSGETVLVLVRKENYNPDRRAVTAGGLLTSLYNLIYYQGEEYPFGQDSKTGVVDTGCEQEKVVAAIFLTTAIVYLNSRRNLDGSIREKSKTVIHAEVEFNLPLNAWDCWGSDVYGESLKSAVIYVAPELKMRAESAFQKLDKLRQGEPIELD